MTAFNPPLNLFFNGITFNPEIIEQGDTVASGGNVTLAGNNTFTGANSFTGGSINVTTQTAGNNTTLAASTAFVTTAVASAVGVSLSGNNNFTGANSFTGGSIDVTTQTAGNNTTLAASTAFITTAINTAITTLKAAANTWSGANNFTTGSIDVTTQTAGNNTTLAASTAFVTTAISALSSIYQTAAQVSTSITSALATFRGTANTFTANQIFSTIQFSSGNLNQQFYIQTCNISFGAVTAGAIVNNTYAYSSLGMSNFPSAFINANISNSSTSANGARIIFSISAQSASSFTVTGMNPTATNAAASAFSITCYGR